MDGKNEAGGWEADKTPSKIIQDDSWAIFTFTSIQTLLSLSDIIILSYTVKMVS